MILSVSGQNLRSWGKRKIESVHEVGESRDCYKSEVRDKNFILLHMESRKFGNDEPILRAGQRHK